MRASLLGIQSCSRPGKYGTGISDAATPLTFTFFDIGTVVRDASGSIHMPCPRRHFTFDTFSVRKSSRFRVSTEVPRLTVMRACVFASYPRSAESCETRARRASCRSARVALSENALACSAAVTGRRRTGSGVAGAGCWSSRKSAEMIMGAWW